MTGVERATLERLEDAITRRLDRIESKVDGVAERVRSVELEQAAYHGAKEEAAEGGSRRMGQAGLAFSFGITILAVPGSVYMVLEIARVLTS